MTIFAPFSKYLPRAFRLSGLNDGGKDVAREEIEGLAAEGVVIPAGEDGDELERGKDEDVLPAASGGVIGGNGLVAELKRAQPPLIAVAIGFEPRGKFTCLDVVFGGVSDPGFADDLFIMPVAAMEKEAAEFGHVAREEGESAGGVENAGTPFAPAVVGDAEGLEEKATGEFRGGKLSAAVDEFAEEQRDGAVVFEFGSGWCDDGFCELVFDEVIAVVQRGHVVARIGIQVGPLFPLQTRSHGEEMFESEIFARAIGEERGVFGKEIGNFFINAADELLIDGDADEDGINGLGDGAHLVEDSGIEIERGAGAIATGKIFFDDELIVFDDEDAVDVAIGAVADARE